MLQSEEERYEEEDKEGVEGERYAPNRAILQCCGVVKNI